MNQSKAIRAYLEEGNTLTSMEAFKMFGCTRLSAKIFNLRQRGYIIDSIPREGVNRYGNDVRFVEYRLVSKPETIGKNVDDE